MATNYGYRCFFNAILPELNRKYGFNLDVANANKQAGHYWRQLDEVQQRKWQQKGRGLYPKADQIEIRELLPGTQPSPYQQPKRQYAHQSAPVAQMAQMQIGRQQPQKYVAPPAKYSHLQPGTSAPVTYPHHHQQPGTSAQSQRVQEQEDRPGTSQQLQPRQTQWRQRTSQQAAQQQPYDPDEAFQQHLQEEIKPNYEDELGITFGKNFWNEFESQRGIKYEMREDEFERYGATIRDALHEQDLTQFHFWLQGYGGKMSYGEFLQLRNGPLSQNMVEITLEILGGNQKDVKIIKFDDFQEFVDNETIPNSKIERSTKFLLLPINLISESNDHIALLSMNITEKSIKIYDSSISAYTIFQKKMYLKLFYDMAVQMAAPQKFRPFIEWEKELEAGNDIQQRNEPDCAVFCVAFAKHLLKQWPLNFSADNIKFYRKMIAKLILQNSGIPKYKY